MSNEQIAVFIRNGQIVVSFAAGNLERDSINLAAQIKRLPDVASVKVQRGGNLIVTLSSASHAASIQRQIAELADDHGEHIAQQSQSAQLSLF